VKTSIDGSSLKWNRRGGSGKVLQPLRPSLTGMIAGPPALAMAAAKTISGAMKA
jgi:hypothetical protein